MNRADATRLDRSASVELDEESECWAVIGAESGFAYSLWCTKSDAVDAADQMIFPRGGRGRPALPEGESRSKMLRLRCREDQLERWQALADRAGVPLSEWVRSTLDGSSDELSAPSSLTD